MAKKQSRIDKRWEEGIPHDPRSIEIYRSIAKLDYEEGGDSFCFKSGGDGDNGEHLMYLLDLHFEDMDAALRAELNKRCEHCGGKLARWFGDLEDHKGDCPSLPL